MDIMDGMIDPVYSLSPVCGKRIAAIYPISDQ